MTGAGLHQPWGLAWDPDREHPERTSYERGQDTASAYNRARYERQQAQAGAPPPRRRKARPPTIGGPSR